MIIINLCSWHLIQELCRREKILPVHVSCSTYLCDLWPIFGWLAPECHQICSTHSKVSCYLLYMLREYQIMKNDYFIWSFIPFHMIIMLHYSVFRFISLFKERSFTSKDNFEKLKSKNFFHTLFSRYKMSTIFSYFAQSGSICVFGGVTKKTKWKPVFRINFFLAFSNGLRTLTASVGASPEMRRIDNQESIRNLQFK